MTTTITGHYTVTATRSHGMWELDVPGIGVTQAERPTEADEMIRDLIEIHTDADADEVDISIVWHVSDDIDARLDRIRAARAEADELNATAARTMRATAAEMKELGMNGRDIAAVLDISEQRVSQLLGTAA